jgi:NTP pyrophosphatase (non-canonical NTP hydrolase)
MTPSNGVPLYTPSSLTTQPKPRIRMPAGKKLVETTGDANYRKLNLLFENIISVIYEDEELPPLSNYVVKLVNNLVDGIPKENMTKVQSLASEIQNGVKDQKVLKNKIIELSKLAMVLYPSSQIDKSGKSPEKSDAKSDDKKKEKEESTSPKTLIKRLLEELTELTKKYTRQNSEIPVSPEIEDIINKLSAISDSIRNTSGISLFGNQKAKTIEDNIKTLKKKIKDKRSLPVSDIEFLSPPLKSISNDL